MGFAQINFFSQSLGKMSAVNVTLPEGNLPGPYSVFYLLHGLSDDQSAWMRRTSIERYAQDYPLLVVMPDGLRGFYADAKEGYAVESHIIKDVIGLIDRTFQTQASRAGRALGGLSMGGYGALKLGLKHPQLFCSVNSHSGVPGFVRREFDPERDQEWIRIFGRNAKGGPEDPYALAEKADHSALPALMIDCGTEDFLIEDNRNFHRHLADLGIKHRYEEHPGRHEWSYWDQHVQEALDFHVKTMGLKKGNG